MKCENCEGQYPGKIIRLRDGACVDCGKSIIDAHRQAAYCAGVESKRPIFKCKYCEKWNRPE